MQSYDRILYILAFQLVVLVTANADGLNKNLQDISIHFFFTIFYVIFLSEKMIFESGFGNYKTIEKKQYNGFTKYTKLSLKIIF